MSALWTPSSPEKTTLADFMAGCGHAGANYQTFWRWSVERNEVFWSYLWDYCGIVGDKGEIVLENASDIEQAQFFPQAQINYAENLLIRRDDNPAIIFMKETGDERIISFAELYALVSRWQKAFKAAGVKKATGLPGLCPTVRKR